MSDDVDKSQARYEQAYRYANVGAMLQSLQGAGLPAKHYAGWEPTFLRAEIRFAGRTWGRG